MCMAEGASSYSWQRGGGIDIPLNATGIQTNTLTLVNLTPPDAGQYRCVADNQHGRNFTEYAILTIEGIVITQSICFVHDHIGVMIYCTNICYHLIVHDPVVTITSSQGRANQGEQATFSCSAIGLGANSFKYGWILNGAPIRRETEQVLKVAALEDTAGDYQCTARNQYGGFGRSNITTLILSKSTT